MCQNYSRPFLPFFRELFRLVARFAIHPIPNPKVMKFSLFLSVLVGFLAFHPFLAKSEEEVSLEKLLKAPKLSESLGSVEFSYGIQYPNLRQRFESKFTLSGGKFAFRRTLTEGKMFHFKSGDFARYVPDDPVIQILSFDGNRHYQLDRGPQASLLTMGLQLKSLSPSGYYTALLENPLTGPSAALLAVLPIERSELVAFLVENEEFSEENRVHLAALHPERFQVKALDGERDFSVDLDWYAGGLLKEMTIKRSDGSETLWSFGRYKTIPYGTGNLQLCRVIEVSTNSELGAPKSSGDFRVELLTDSIEMIPDGVATEKFVIPTGVADIVRDSDFDRLLKHPAD